MKTNQLILAAALVALAASCNKEEFTTPGATLDNEIGFTAVTKKATKANDAIISGTSYATDNTFQVWGWQSENGLFTDTALTEGAASNFMSDLTISYNDGHDHARANAWRNAEHYYYWPFTGKISFLAVHPSTVAPSTTGWDATNKKPKATFADYTISAANKTVDLMLANNEGARRADALPMVFSHALSQILFKIKTEDDYTSDVTFKVNSIKINNIDLSGDVAYANEAITWSDNEAQTENWTYYATAQEAVKTVADYGVANVMIPQAANADDPATTNAIEGTTLTINYTMTQTGSAAITGDVTVSAAQLWEAGKKYLYTINFKLNEILFNPSVTDWVDVNVATINILD